MSGGRKRAHVGPDFGDDDLDRNSTKPWFDARIAGALAPFRDVFERLNEVLTLIVGTYITSLRLPATLNCLNRIHVVPRDWHETSEISSILAARPVLRRIAPALRIGARNKRFDLGSNRSDVTGETAALFRLIRKSSFSRESEADKKVPNLLANLRIVLLWRALP
jgi:hypothetical protein